VLEATGPPQAASPPPPAAHLPPGRNRRQPGSAGGRQALGWSGPVHGASRIGVYPQGPGSEARLSICTIALLLLCGSLASADPGSTLRPNIVLIVGDDHGYPYSGFMGSPFVHTPRLDDLARGGTVFTTAYVTASACRPSLLSLLTGLHPRQPGAAREAPDPGSEAALGAGTLPALLARHGYASFQAGKWWEGSYAAAGFSEGTKTGAADASMVAWMGGAQGLAVGRETLDPVFDFIDRHRETPFFLWFAPLLPHRPWNAPPQYLEPYADKGLSRSAVAYYANITRLDDAVGRLVAHLDARGLLSRTLIVYLSDNGFRQGPHEEASGTEGSGPGGKGWMNELGFRTPIVFHWRGHVPAGAVRDDLVSSLDLFPTLLAYAGLPAPADRTGVDLRPLLEGRAGPPRSELVGHMENVHPHLDAGHSSSDAETGGRRTRAYFLRNARWHYVWSPEDGDDQLYDLETDPEERSNALREHPELVADFRRRIERWDAALRAGPDGGRAAASGGAAPH
jgi:uncharacterized sulfatase